MTNENTFVICHSTFVIHLNDPDFKNLTVSIIGLGLMGGSLALALRARAREIIGCDTDSAAVAFALNHHIITRAADFDSALD
jgi:prephenate dehydrogenase